jgi:NAD(P)-dependent dehydrogenase (short-subunit alcohol dehydrogenase family)
MFSRQPGWAARGIDWFVFVPRLESFAEEIRRHGVRALPVVADVSDFAAVEAAANRIEQELGPIEVWVNNAMATVFAPVSELSP